MNKIEAQSAFRKLNKEAFSLEPNALVTMFEIDMTDILFDMGVINTADKLNNPAAIFRFHNTQKLMGTDVWWQNRRYVAAPITAEGFEMSAKGALPVPKLSISVSDDGIQTLGILKTQIAKIGDLVGAKVTRIRTFATHLDERNLFAEAIKDFEPDPNVEFPRDIYYVERKAFENKLSIQYELSSIFDLEGVKVPGRLVTNNKCMWTYRGEGCLYEYTDRRVNKVHGTDSILPYYAPPVANEIDEQIITILNIEAVIDKGEWNDGITYSKGDSAYIEKNGVKYYFVCKSDDPPDNPPSLKYWQSDTCSKTVKGCKLRFPNLLPIGSFPGTARFS